MEIIALQEYTDKYISLYEGEIRNINESLANKLIEKNIVQEHSNIVVNTNTSSNMDNSNQFFIVEFEFDDENQDWSVDKTYEEIAAALESGKLIFGKSQNEFGMGLYETIYNFEGFNEFACSFSTVARQGNQILYKQFVLQPNNNINYSNVQLYVFSQSS